MMLCLPCGDACSFGGTELLALQGLSPAQGLAPPGAQGAAATPETHLGNAYFSTVFNMRKVIERREREMRTTDRCLP